MKLQRKVELYDSSLRDGAQGEGISFSMTDKLSIIQALDLLGVPYIEIGNPMANPKDQKLCREIAKLPLVQAKVAVFGSTRRKGISVEADENLKALLEAETEVVAIFGKSWKSHAEEILGVSGAENLDMISDSVRYLKRHGRMVVFDAEHFFDGYAENPEYAMNTLITADEAGADRLILCDTRGCAYPDIIQTITKQVIERFGDKVGVHLHNDNGCAVAGSIAAVDGGAIQVQGTLLGYGERAGNANLSAIAGNLELIKGYSCLGKKGMERLTRTARFVAEISNVPLDHSAPYVGAGAFAHKAGMHAAAVLKNPKSYEHIAPEKVGNTRKILMSEHTGRTAILSRVSSILPGLSKESPELKKLVKEIKRLEAIGYSFEAAEASFELMVRRALGVYQPFFELVSYYSIGEYPSKGESSTASVLIQVGDKQGGYMAKGDGPVHALDMALREALKAFFPGVGGARLSDYKVRVLEPQKATAAQVRVLIESTDGKHRWSTVGVSTDIIRASLTALTDSFEYKLFLDAKQEADGNEFSDC